MCHFPASGSGLSSPDPNVRLYGQARFQKSICIELLFRSPIKINPYRHALHDFNVVPGGVFRRQQTEDRARAPTHTRYPSFPRATVCIEFDLNGLSRSHMGQLRFFEVRGDPNIVERNNLYQLLSDADVLANRSEERRVGKECRL